MGEGLTITVQYKFKPGLVEGFCEILPTVLVDTAKFAGFRNLKAVRHSEDRDRVILIETWDDQESYKKYIAWRTERGDVSGLDDQLVEPPVYDLWPEFITQV